MIDWLTEPWSTDLVARAGLELILVGILGGALGVFVVLRGLPFTVEAFSHTVFPGAVLAAAAGGSIIVGGAIAGLVAAAAIMAASRSSRTSDETAIGVVFTGLFALGVVLASVLAPLERDLDSVLFGSLLGVTTDDLLVSAALAAIIAGALFAVRRHLVASSFERDTAAADGSPLLAVDGFLLATLALAVVISVQAVGVILVLSLFVTPAAAARLVTRRLRPMLIAAVILGVLTGVAGLYLSYYADVAAGGAVVLTATALFVLSWLASPHSGPIAALRRPRAARPARP